MAQLSERLAGLSPARRKLLASLLERGKAAQPASPGAADAPAGESGGSGEKGECRQFYDAINASLDASPAGPFALFLNLGYVPDASPSHSVVQLPPHWIGRHSARLVLEVIGGCSLEGRRVLDVGCGRGGSVSLIAQFFDPVSVTGVDLSPAAIAFCRAQHQHPSAHFDVGDAEQLGYADAAFDAVVNIESSSTYPNVFAFYRQVFRVLAPDGDFLYTDALPVAKFAEGARYLQSLSLRLETDRDITSNVLRACDEAAGRHLQAINQPDAAGLDAFVGAPGTHFYEAMRRGEWSYRIQHWKKAA